MKLIPFPSPFSSKPSKTELPLVPLRELVVSPHMNIPFFAGRPSTIKSIEEAMKKDRMVFLVCQKNETESPTPEDVHTAGTTAKILQMLKLPDGSIRVLAEGRQRGLIKKSFRRQDVLFAQLELIEEDRVIDPLKTALMASAREAYTRYSKFYKKPAAETMQSVEKAEYPDKLVDLIVANSHLKPEKKAELLGITNTAERIETLTSVLEAENEVLALQSKIQLKVKQRLEKNQKEYFLHEQLKQINKELGREDEDESGIKELKAKVLGRKPPPEVLEKCEKEFKRLSRMQPMSPESGVVRTYLEWIADLPWSARGTESKDIERAEIILDEDHYNLKKAKERILDFIAVRILQERVKGPILCLVGPPGTGKTSLGRSVARALGREFVRISLGGVRDEAEIRGHRKTYVGALPGKIIQSMKKTGTINPVFLLDEIDKLSSDFRGDPASALLEVLDPEQNSTFADHYLEVPYDLSSVMFITTANSIHGIPLPLRDRMEIIEIPGYTDLEKERIAADFIIPKQLKENGLENADITFQKPAVLEIIRSYTMESGVRNLEREIASVIRKLAREAVRQGCLSGGLQTEEDATGPSDAPEESTSESEESIAESEESKDEGRGGKNFTAVVTKKSLIRYLGQARFEGDLVYRQVRPGLAHGLAWTEMGGKLLPVEVSVLKGSGKLILTGNMGDVMKESAQIALSFLRAESDTFNLDPDFHKDTDIHIHVPQGAIPKDGPSAGITMIAAMLSALTCRPIEKSAAMTGEATLTGRLIAIGGVKEKTLAAYRNGMLQVVMPEDNRKDIEELPPEVRNTLNFHFFTSIKEALLHLLPG